MILLTGGSGLLGAELRKLLNVFAPSHKDLDITKPETLTGDYEIIIHAAAYTDVVKAETDKEDCFRVNVTGTLNLLKAYPDSNFVYISSEYSYNPVNYYSETKLAGETAIKVFAKRYLIIRTLFKPNPFPYVKAFNDQYTQGDYVDVIAPLIAKEIKNWNQENKTVYVGTGRKTMLELARRTRPDIKAISVEDIKNVKLSKDYI